MSRTDNGEWRIFHPEELVATFLLPLPDPIPLQDGTIIPTYRRLEVAGVQLMTPWLEELWLGSLDEPLVVPASEMHSSSADAPPHVNWSNKLALLTSIQFHQTFSDAGLRIGLEPAMRLAEVVSGLRVTAEEKIRALTEVDGASYPGSAELRELGLGAVSVAECYVGLRILADLPELTSPLTPGFLGLEPPFGPLESERLYPDDITMWQWRVFPADCAPDPDLVERRLRNALRVALTEVRSIQRAVQALRRTPAVIAALERLPFIVPVVLRRAGEVGARGGSAQTLMLATRPSMEPLVAPDPLGGDELAALNEARRRVDGGPFAAHVDVHREAHVALERLGDHRLAALLLGVAAESLFDELILHLMWEEGMTPEYVAEHWLKGLDARVRQMLPNRLGGVWDVTRRNPVGVWAQDVASLRHRVAHAAYTPTAEEAHRSFEAVNGLVTYLCDRLATSEVRRRYPRTALALAGESGLRRRGSYTRRIQELQNDPAEVSWTITFFRWREAWRRSRQDITAQPRVPSETESALIAVRHPDGSLVWVRHDRAQHLAIEVDVWEDDLMDGFTEQVHAVADGQHRVYDNAAPISTAYMGSVRTSYRPGALWVEDYHYLPMTEVMVDRSDYQQPTETGIRPA